METRVVLPRELRIGADDHEIVLLAAQPPKYISSWLVNPIDCKSIASGHQNVVGAVREPNRVQMIGIPDIAAGGRARSRLIGIAQRNMLKGAPKKQELIRAGINLLNGEILHISIFLAPRKR